MSTMFHTFETTQYNNPGQADANATSAAKRRTSTVRACEPCRRRKIRCNGEHPCETCQWYRKAASCHYTEPRQRQVPSRRSVEKISQTLQEYRGILQKLFPNVHPEQLTGLSREKLIELISKTGPFQAPSPLTPGQEEKPHSIHPDAGSLEQLQPLPEESQDVYYSEDRPKLSRGLTDDVNSLSITGKESSSYLGISSVMAALRVILWLDPDCQAYVNKSNDQGHAISYSRETSSPSDLPELSASTTPKGVHTPISSWDEIPMINAYFQYVHPFIPLIDEQIFRDAYMTKQRVDSRWLLLLNAVLAMGSIANGNSQDSTHEVYFARAKEYLTVDTLGAAHIETVQALAILSGFYLQYIQEPNLANAMMGATLRMSTVLGLHRDFSEGLGPTNSNTQKATFSIEMRRRVWWSTFMLDAWVGNTLGRPSMGRMSHAITARSPQEAIGGSLSTLHLTQENVRFTLISTRMEDSLAMSPIMEESERQSLDNAFVEWFHSSSVRNTTLRAQSHTSSPVTQSAEMPGLTVIKNVMRWRYLSARIILHRPVLLWYAMRKMPFDALPEEKRLAIDLCREVTAELISDITSTWQGQKPCQIAGWHATTLLYHAVMVPLLSLFSDASDASIVERSRQQVETSMAVLSDLIHWSCTAKRSLEVVSRIYEASRRHSPEPEEFGAHDMSLESGDLGTPATLASSGIAPSQTQHMLASQHHSQHLGQQQQRPTFIDLQNFTTTPTSTHSSSSHFSHQQQHHPHHLSSSAHPSAPHPILTSSNQPPTTASQELFMDNMFDSLNWSTGWNNNDYPFETPRLGWDYNAMNGWAGAPQGGVGEFEGYFASMNDETGNDGHNPLMKMG